VVQTADADDDGIPDDDPSVPLDEERFGSSPQRADTDGDGLSDLMEVMACNWVEDGLGEKWAGDPRQHHCNPTNADSDGDGLRDGEDPYLLYPIDPVLKRGEAWPFAALRDKTAQATFHLGWDEKFLTIRVTVARGAPPEKIKIMLDADDDGWYVGGDNFMFHVRPAGGLRMGSEWWVNAAGTFAAGFHNCSVPGKWPFFDGTRLGPDEIKFDQEISKGGYACAIRVPRRPENGVSLTPGERIGILFALSAAGRSKSPGPDRMLTVFEPHAFVTFILAK
jgi:hypothetical protein